MPTPTKFNEKIASEIIAYCWKGLTHYQIATTLGIHPQTIIRWRKVHPSLKSTMDMITERLARTSIESGLKKRAEGFTEEEVTEKYVVSEELADGSVRMKEVTKKKKYFPPDVNAIGMLARKHAPDDYIEKKVEEKNVNVKITQRDRALTLDERRKLLANDASEGVIEAEYTEKE